MEKSIAEELLDMGVYSKSLNGAFCVTPDGLDRLWPRENVEPLIITGKAFNMPPTCSTHDFTDAELLTFLSCQNTENFTCMGVSSDNIPSVPIPIGGLLLFSALAFLFVVNRVFF